MAEILYKQLSYAIIGAAMEVHRTLGPGFLEAVYQASLAHELSLRNIQFTQFQPLPVSYKGILVGNYEADFVVESTIILELKAALAFHPKHDAQTINYLAATGYQLALLLNFGAESLQHKRLIRHQPNKSVE
jgi:GxxExxY protein